MTPTDAYRGAGRPEATYAIERAMDALAAKVGIDPVELRRRNFIKTEQFPYTAFTGLVYDSGDHDGARSTRRSSWSTTTACAPSRQRRRAAGGTKHLGIGVSSLLRDVRPGAVAGCWPR